MNFWCDLLVSLARKLFFNWLCLNVTNLELNYFDLIGLGLYYKKLNSNWLELDYIFEVP